MRLELLLQTEIEIRRIHADKKRRRMAPEVARQPASHGNQFGVAPQRLETDQGQPLQGIHADTAFRLHLRSGNALELELRHFLLERAHQPGRKDIAGDLAGDNADADRRIVPCHVSG